jgi:hypothetical protein
VERLTRVVPKVVAMSTFPPRDLPMLLDGAVVEREVAVLPSGVRQLLVLGAMRCRLVVVHAYYHWGISTPP